MKVKDKNKTCENCEYGRRREEFRVDDGYGCTVQMLVEENIPAYERVDFGCNGWEPQAT